VGLRICRGLRSSGHLSRARHADWNDRRYEGDLSAWGRKRVNLNNKDSESDYTMSSGLSPRGKEEEERAEFDVEDGKRALAYQAGTAVRACY
jgi:hypothetical protein